jgi:hypothetical protein
MHTCLAVRPTHITLLPFMADAHLPFAYCTELQKRPSTSCPTKVKGVGTAWLRTACHGGAPMFPYPQLSFSTYL